MALAARSSQTTPSAESGAVDLEAGTQAVAVGVGTNTDISVEGSGLDRSERSVLT